MNLSNKTDILEFIFNSLSFVFWKDLKGIYRGGNDNQARAFGFSSPIDFIGKTIYDILDDYDSAKVIDENDQKVMKNLTECVLEEKIVMRDGSVKHFLSKKSPLFNNNNDLIGLLGTAVDITNLVMERENKVKLEKETALLKLQMDIEVQKAIVNEHVKFNDFIDEMQRMIKVYQLNKLNDRLSKGSDFVNLTLRENEVLYLLSLGKKPKDIANILSEMHGRSITSATISSIIDKQLYRKFDVNSTSLLIEKAIMLKVIPLIPDNWVAH